ncbi:MAG: protein-glutamate O-methyltransferase CheR [Geobacter sp.]|nr:protein-glutamate O-methyltransferase CheR [Geobacter sp.]
MAAFLAEKRDFRLGSYKDKCIKRRIAIRIRATSSASPEEYLELLNRDPQEIDLLLKVLTIHVSQFFRNPSTFTKLTTDIFPYLLFKAENEGRAELNIWSVGCSSGEEPYTLAILVLDTFAEELDKTAVSIQATDIDERILEMAQEALYEPERLKDVPPLLKERYFEACNGRFRPVQQVRGMVCFRQCDLLHENSFVESDLILCRNVLIYLERSEQERILRMFADALRPGGILVLGKSETLVGTARSLFRTVCPVERIYKKL